MSSASARINSAYPVGALPLLLTFFLIFAAFESSANSADEAKRLDFDVFLGDRPIGSHEFVLQESKTETRVEMAANFKVKVLFVTAFAYEHSNVETWRDNCLQRIDASTKMNGDRYRVDGRQTADGFVLESAPTDEVADSTSCASSFAYWDRRLLESGMLLNSQTGEFTPTRLLPLGSDQLQIGTQSVPVKRYALRGEGVEVTLAYTDSTEGREEWVGLESKVQGGRILRYVRTPASLL